MPENNLTNEEIIDAYMRQGLPRSSAMLLAQQVLTERRYNQMIVPGRITGTTVSMPTTNTPRRTNRLATFTRTSVNPEVAPEAPETLTCDEPGELITSLRTFGIEYEVNLAWSASDTLRGMIHRAYNVVHDGSVRRGLEVVSPILSGKVGEQEIDNVCKSLAAVHAGADETCGLHVHFGAKDFFKKVKTEIWPLSSALKYQKEKPSNFSFYILHDSIIKRIYKKNQYLAQQILRARPISFFESEQIAEEMSGCGATQARFPGKGMPKNFVIYTTHKAIQDMSRVPIILSESIDGVIKYSGKPGYNPASGRIMIDPKTSGSMRVLVINSQDDGSAQLSKLKRLAAFYVVFDDVIASMLPGDRRENDYSRRVNHRMSVENIRDARSLTSFMKAWFNFTHDEQITDARPDSRPRARYCGLNLYALLKQSTIEIRYLGGTIDPQTIKHWVALHHAIIDLAADTSLLRGSVDSISKASLIVDIEKKTTLFFKKLRLNYETESFIRQMIEQHRNDDDILLNECIDEDTAQPPKMSEANLEAALEDLVDND